MSSRAPRPAISCVVAALALLLLAPAAARASDPFQLTPESARLAQVVFPTVGMSEPGAGSAVVRLATQARWGGGPVQLLVLRSQRDESGRLWLEVELPDRPNGRTAWIQADHTRLGRTPWRIVVSTARRSVSVYRQGRLVRSFGAVVGEPSTPTPHGLFAVYARIPQRQPGGFLGPWALHLTATSDVLFDFGGGPGRIAIHGRGGASLADPLGTARSHGCIRISNDEISWLAGVAVEGTPVDVVA